MEESEKTVIMHLPFNGTKVVITVKAEDEPIYSKARKMIAQRSLELQEEHTYHLNPLQIANLVAVEALVDALRLQEEYKNFQDDVNSYLNDLNGNVA